MKKTKGEVETGPTIRDLYPHLDEAQLKEAEDNLQRYFEIALRIYDRLESEKNVVNNQCFDGPTERS